MPDISVSDEQADRLDEVREELSEIYATEYATVGADDALEYLLDTYRPPDVDDEGAANDEGDDDGSENGDGDEEDETGDDGDDGDDDADDANEEGNDDPAATLQQAMDLLDEHDERWSEGSGDEPYEVELPDGSTEGARTKDDVKRLLFQHWR